MKLATLSLSLVLGAGCATETTDVSEEVTLADLDAALVVLDGADTLAIAVEADGCPRLGPHVVATLDNFPGTTTHGGVTQGHEDFGHPYESCTQASFGWSKSKLPVGTSTVTIREAGTTWTLTIDRPTVRRTLEVVDPRPSYRPGDPIAVRIVPSGALTGAEVRFDDVVVASETTPDGALAFAVPGDAAGEVALSVDAQVAAPILGCTAPGGCTAAPRGAVLDAILVIEP